MSPITILALAISSFGVVLCVILLSFFGPWLKCQLAQAPVGWAKLIARRLKQVPVQLIVDAFIRLRKHGIPVQIDDIADAYLREPKEFDLYVETYIETLRYEKASDGETPPPAT